MSITWELTPGQPPQRLDERAPVLTPQRVVLLAGLAAAGVVLGVTVGFAVSRDEAVMPEAPAAAEPAAAPVAPAAAPRRVDTGMLAGADTGASPAVPSRPENIAMSKSVAAPAGLPTGSSRFEVETAEQETADAGPLKAAMEEASTGQTDAAGGDPDKIELVVDGGAANPLLRDVGRSAVDTATAFAAEPAVAIAETDAETRVMESTMAAGGAEEFVPPQPDAETRVAAVAEPVEEPDVKPAAPRPAARTAVSTSGLGRATTTKAVNMRSRPDNGASVVAVVPGGASILAPSSCKYWCRTVYQGKSGYIYKSFIRR